MSCSPFARVIGIDYSGAATADDPLPGLRVYLADNNAPPHEVRPMPNQRRHWTRRALAHWLVAQLSDGLPTLVGIDHAFSFPLAYFQAHGLPLRWHVFLEDFCAHWLTDAPGVRVDDVRRGRVGNGTARQGDARWRRLTDRRTGAKSVFHFDVTGSVAKSTHAGLPWLRFVRVQLGARVHVWPFDGWHVPSGVSALAEVYPSLWRDQFPSEGRTPDQHDAFVVAARLWQAMHSGELCAWLAPPRDPQVRALAALEGWILGA